MGIQIEKTALDGLLMEVKQDDRYIYVRPIVTDIHDLIETLLIEEGKQLTTHTVAIIKTLEKIKIGKMQERDRCKKLKREIITMKEAIKKRKHLKKIIKNLIRLEENLLESINTNLQKGEIQNEKIVHQLSNEG